MDEVAREAMIERLLKSLREVHSALESEGITPYELREGLVPLVTLMDKTGRVELLREVVQSAGECVDKVHIEELTGFLYSQERYMDGEDTLEERDNAYFAWKEKCPFATYKLTDLQSAVKALRGINGQD